MAPRTRRSLVIICVAALLFATIVTAVASHFAEVLVPIGIILPVAAVRLAGRTTVRCHERSISLLSLDASRAPPAALA